MLPGTKDVDVRDKAEVRRAAGAGLEMTVLRGGGWRGGMGLTQRALGCEGKSIRCRFQPS